MRFLAARLIAAGLVGFALLASCATVNAERQAPMFGDLIEISGTALHVADIGPRDSDLTPVVLIHGASVNMLDMHMALGERLALDRRVILIDRPGRGYSERPKDGHRLEVQADLIAGVVDELGVERPTIVGQSFGGAVALAYALNHRDQMSSLVLLAPVSHEWPGGVAWYNNVSQIPVAGFVLRRLIIPVYAAIVREASVAASFAPNAPPENYAQRAGLALLFRAKDFRANAADIANLKSEIVRQQTRYGEILAPTEIVAGRSDTTVSPAIHSQALARQIPGAQLTLLDDTGHALHHAQTDIIIEIIDRAGARAALP